MADHAALEKLSSTTPMLPTENKESPFMNGMAPSAPPYALVGKILLREDTYLGRLGGGCTGCNGVKVTCAGVRHTGALCWGKCSEKRCGWLLTFLVAMFLINMVGAIVFCFTNVFDDSLRSNLAIVNNSMTYNMWKKPPVNPINKIYLFNYTNLEAYKNKTDKKLRVEEVGPYVYSEVMERFEIQFNEDDTVSYREKREFTFRADLSKGKQFDKVIVPNLPYLTAVSMVKDAFYPARFGLNLAIQGTRSEPFMTLPVHRFLWGYEDKLVNLAKPILSFKGDVPSSLGILAGRNGTSKDIITVETGAKDINKLGLIRSVNDLKKMTHWGTDHCNSIEATDGSMFSPNSVAEKKTIYIFNKQLCRRLPFEFREDIEVWDGIPAYRYAHPLNIFDHPSQNPENQCYCHIDTGVCSAKGIFNTAPCAYGAPAMTSFPHFYLGDASLVNALDGLKPNKSLHDSYLDIQPRLGFPLGGTSRIQFNMEVIKAEGINDYLPDGLILPIMWMEVTIEQLPPSIRTLVYHGTYSAAAIQMALSWGCSLMFLFSGLALVFVIRHKTARRKRRNCSMLKKENIGNIVKIGNEKMMK